MKSRIAAVVFGANMLAIPAASALDQALPSYRTVTGISGQLRSVGSDTLNNEMTLWAKGFMQLYPDVKIEVEGKGSATAPPALLQGASQFGPMSRPMTSEEAAYPITRYLYVYLNKSPNQQLDPLRSEFIKYILSKDGQTQTEIGGYYPITDRIREDELQKLGLLKLSN